MSRVTAADRMRRVLAIVPWIVANPGEKVADVAARFGLTEPELLADLGVVYMVGLPPYSPDALVDVQIDDEGCVTIRLADFFSRPLRLSPGQGLALLASSDGLLSVPGTDPDGALARALSKLGAALGVGDDEESRRVDVHLGAAEGRMLDQLRSAAGGGTEVELTYYSYNRDARSNRTIAPWRVFADSGNWYVHGWCHLAEDERIFRVDRIEDITELDQPAAVRPDDADEGAGVFHPRETDPRITLDLSPQAAWVVDSYPCEQVVERPDGRVEATLVITALPWLERLLIRLGPDAVVVDSQGLEDAKHLVSKAAGRMLARYQPA